MCGVCGRDDRLDRNILYSDSNAFIVGDSVLRIFVQIIVDKLCELIVWIDTFFAEVEATRRSKTFEL